MDDGTESSTTLVTSSGEGPRAFYAYDHPLPDAKCDADLLICKPCRELVELLLEEPMFASKSSANDQTTQAPNETKEALLAAALPWPNDGRTQTQNKTMEALLASARGCATCRLVEKTFVHPDDYQFYEVSTQSLDPGSFCISGRKSRLGGEGGSNTGAHANVRLLRSISNKPASTDRTQG